MTNSASTELLKSLRFLQSVPENLLWHLAKAASKRTLKNDELLFGIGISIGVGRVYGVIDDLASAAGRSAVCPPPRGRSRRAGDDGTDSRRTVAWGW